MVKTISCGHHMKLRFSCKLCSLNVYCLHQIYVYTIFSSICNLETCLFVSWKLVFLLAENCVHVNWKLVVSQLETSVFLRQKLVFLLAEKVCLCQLETIQSVSWRLVFLLAGNQCLCQLKNCVNVSWKLVFFCKLEFSASVSWNLVFLQAEEVCLCQLETNVSSSWKLALLLAGNQCLCQLETDLQNPNLSCFFLVGASLRSLNHKLSLSNDPRSFGNCVIILQDEAKQPNRKLQCPNKEKEITMNNNKSQTVGFPIRVKQQTKQQW